MAIIWLLDVDGVINASRPGWGASPRSGTAHSGGYSFRIRWAPELILRIRDVRERGVDVRWCTTWCTDADQIERLTGLPPLTRCWTDPINGHEASEAKRAAARAAVATGDRLIWTDDAITPTDGPLYDELTRDGRALLIAPKASRGLQPSDLFEIRTFVEQTGRWAA